MKSFWKVVLSPYQDPVLALWMKAALTIIWACWLLAGILLREPAAGLLLQAGMAALLLANCVRGWKKANMPADWCVYILLTIANLIFFYQGYIGYFSAFYPAVFSVAAVFILGIRRSLVLNAGILICTLWWLCGQSAVRMERIYQHNLVLRYPYLYLCILGIAYIVMYSIQADWLRKAGRKAVLEERIRQEKKKLAEMSLKITTAMYRALSAKIPQIDQHCESVGEDSRAIAKKLNLPEQDCENAYYAGLLHEVGAVGLPDEVLQKNSLTDEQYELFKTYVGRGFKIIKELQIVDKVAAAVLYHRENYDGTGYLAGLKENEIPILARILAVADYTDRHRRRGESGAVIAEKLKKNSGTVFDPECAAAMCCLLEETKEE